MKKGRGETGQRLRKRNTGKSIRKTQKRKIQKRKTQKKPVRKSKVGGMSSLVGTGIVGAALIALLIAGFIRLYKKSRPSHVEFYGETENYWSPVTVNKTSNWTGPTSSQLDRTDDVATPSANRPRTEKIS